MAFKSSKHRKIVPLHFTPTGGVNLALPSHAIRDNELTEAHNMIYLPNDSILATRPAFECVTASALECEEPT